MVGAVIWLLAGVGCADEKRCSVDTDCEVGEVCIRSNLEGADGQRYCRKLNHENASLLLRYRNAEEKGAPVRQASKGVWAGRIVLYSGIAVAGGFALAGSINTAASGLGGDGEIYSTWYLAGITVGFGLISIAPLISNIAMQLRQNAYEAMGYAPSSRPAAVSWALGSVGIAFYAAAVSLYYVNPESHQWAWSLAAPAVVCSIAVDALRLYWNRRLVRSVSQGETGHIRLYPTVSGVESATESTGGLTVGVGGIF